MNFANELAALFRRDLTRLTQELHAFGSESDLWRTLPGVSNSAGNLTLHLEGNMREYVGRLLGNVAYTRERPLEFSLREITLKTLTMRIDEVKGLVVSVIDGLSVERLDSTFPVNIWGTPFSTRQTLMSLHAHVNFHLGQIDYLRRILTSGAAIELAGL